jgi:hypothetical protein
VALPSVSVTATPDANDPTGVDVSWASPGAGNVYQVYVVTQDGRMKPWLSAVSGGSRLFQGKADQSYWFWVSVTTDLGWSDAAGSMLVHTPVVNHGQLV